MTRIYLALDDALAVIRSMHGEWRAQWAITDHHHTCVAVDPLRPQRVYSGTLDHGLWCSDAGSDGNAGWRQIGQDALPARIMAVAADPRHTESGYSRIWVGSEPSAIYASDDGGETWQDFPQLQSLPSKPTWSFPPRPWTHHIRWIQPDPYPLGPLWHAEGQGNRGDGQRLFVGIELGGVMRSLDGGATWEDRKPGSQHDCHTLRMHPLAPGRVYEAAGGGYAESEDGGATWRGYDTGMRHHYVWGLAVDPGDPETIVASAAFGPRQAHDTPTANATLYRRSGSNGNPGPWEEVRTGLPPREGTRIYVLATNPAEPGVFYAATGSDLYRSTDGGQAWAALDVQWPGHYHSHDANALAVTAG